MSGIQSFESNRIFTVSTSQRCVPEAHAGCDRSLNLIPIAKIGIFEIYRSTSFLTQGSIVPHTGIYRSSHRLLPRMRIASYRTSTEPPGAERRLGRPARRSLYEYACPTQLGIRRPPVATDQTQTHYGCR